MVIAGLGWVSCDCGFGIKSGLGRKDFEPLVFVFMLRRNVGRVSSKVGSPWSNQSFPVHITTT